MGDWAIDRFWNTLDYGPTAMNQILEDLRSRYGFDQSVSCLLYPDR